LPKIFNLYAKYYDLLYRDKNYLAESNYIKKLINLYKPDSKNLLDLGCGTGRHILNIAGSGIDVSGVELSEVMLEKAIENLRDKSKLHNRVKFYHGDIKSIRLKEKFDVIIMLFHVMSYQNSNNDIMLTLKTIKEHLNENGICIFDFWYGPGVLTERPEKRERILSDDEISIFRTSNPVMRINENIVEVNFHIDIKDENGIKIEEFAEIHSMRYLFKPEIKLFLNYFNMSLIHIEEWMTGKMLSEKSWYATAIIGNKSEK